MIVRSHGGFVGMCRLVKVDLDNEKWLHGYVMFTGGSA